MKTLLLTAMVISNLLTIAPAFAGNSSGGGGDASEERVDEIRSDILNWINKDGAKDLQLSSDISYGEYVAKMTDILQPKKVVIAFVEKDDQNNDELKVSVDGLPKTCRGFFSKKTSVPHILCNISRFENIKDEDQYKLIHHEFAGLVDIEKNENAASDYKVSTQITEYLTLQTVLKLAIKKKVNQTFTGEANITVSSSPLNLSNGCTEASEYSFSKAKLACYQAGYTECEKIHEAEISSSHPEGGRNAIVGGCHYKTIVKGSKLTNAKVITNENSITTSSNFSRGCNQAKKQSKEAAILQCFESGFASCHEIETIITRSNKPVSGTYAQVGGCTAVSIIKAE